MSRPADKRRTSGHAWQEIRAIAGIEALDGIRARRQLVVRGLTPVLLFVCVLGVTLVLRGADTRTHPDPYRVAVEGDYAGARQTLDGLNPTRLEFYAADDARLAAIERADAGLRVPAGLDAALAAPADAGASASAPQLSSEIPLEVYQVTVNPPSRAAAVLIQSAFADRYTSQVRVRLDEARRSGLGTGETVAPIGSLSVETVTVELTQSGTRTLTSQVIPGLICLQAALLVTGTANRLVSRRTRGLLMTQLLLPISRRGLATAKGLGELLVGLVTAAPVIVAILGFGVIMSARGSSTINVVLQSGATVVAMVALFAFMTSVGVGIGTAARTQEQVSLATGAAVIIAALVATTMALSEVTPPMSAALIPFAGLVATLRETLNGTGSPLPFAAAVASTLLGSLVLSALAGRALDAERLVMRGA